MVAKSKSVSAKNDAPRAVASITTFDHDTISVVQQFNTPKRYSAASEAMEKLIQRAVRLRLHRLNDVEFEALVDAESVQR